MTETTEGGSAHATGTVPPGGTLVVRPDRGAARRARRRKLYIPVRQTDLTAVQVRAVIDRFSGGRLGG